MKNLTILFFVFFSLHFFAQKKAAVVQKTVAQKDLATMAIPKSKLMSAKGIQDLIFVPKGCKISTYLFTCEQFGNFHEIQCKGGAFSKEVLLLFTKGHANQVYIFDHIKSSCGKAVKKRYEIKIKP